MMTRTLLPLILLFLAAAPRAPRAPRAPLAAQRADTTAVKAGLLTADRALAARVASRGPGALLDALAPGAPLLFPDTRIFFGVADARTLFLARYAAPGTRSAWTPQHAVVSTDGTLGCTVGTTRMTLATDTSRTPRHGRYVTCWARDAGGTWHIAGHSRNGEDPAIAPPKPALAGAPRSADFTTGTAALKDIQDADAAFARLATDSSPALAFSRYAAADAMLLGGRPSPARGPEEIGAAFASFPATGTFSWAPVRTAGAARGGLGFTTGEAVIVSGGQESHSKYITVWRQERDGRWKYILDLGSARP